MQEVRLGQVWALQEQDLSGARTQAGTTGALDRQSQASSGHQSRKKPREQSMSSPQGGLLLPGVPSLLGLTVLSEADAKRRQQLHHPPAVLWGQAQPPQHLRVPICKKGTVAGPTLTGLCWGGNKCHLQTHSWPPVLETAVLCSARCDSTSASTHSGRLSQFSRGQ